MRAMKWIPALMLSLVLVGSVHAAGPDDQYLEIYAAIEQGDSAAQAGDARVAVARYSFALDSLKKLQSSYPTWNPDVVKFRQEYISDKLGAAIKQLPAETAAPVAQTNAPKTATIADLQQQAADLADQIRTLAADKATLEKKLKEALSIQPAAADAGDLAKAQEEILALKKERDLLTVTLAQERAKTSAPSEKPSADKPAKTAPSADVSALEKQLAAAQALNANLQKEIAELKTKLSAKEAKRSKNAAERENEQLRARIAALEAHPVAYTPEEQEILKSGSAQPSSFHVVTEAPKAPKKGIHSVKDLPPGAGAMMAEAQRLFVAGEFETAEKKYLDVLRQDDKNVYVLAHLANAQLALNHLEDCEKNVKTALSVDPDDAASLFLLGNLRLKQEKVDEALDALSRSAQINPTNAVTQNSLGTALSRKGMEKAAESALRKALQLDPGFPEAHHNLAIIYATQKPPSMELARWHYKKAIDAGQPRNTSLEKVLNPPAAADAPAAAPAPAATGQ